MRVNMDSSVATDPEFRLIASDLGIPLAQVIGHCFLIWLSAYNRRSKRFSMVEADVAADLSGFAEAMVKRNLATQNDDDTIELRGVDKRIRFLKSQAERGAKGGKESGKSRRRKSKQTQSHGRSKRFSDPEATDEAYSPDHAPAQDHAPKECSPARSAPSKNGPRDLPADWGPNESHAAIATERNLDLDEQAAKFRDYFASRGKRRKDWDATFRNWLRSDYATPKTSLTSERAPVYKKIHDGKRRL